MMSNIYGSLTIRQKLKSLLYATQSDMTHDGKIWRWHEETPAINYCLGRECQSGESISSCNLEPESVKSKPAIRPKQKVKQMQKQVPVWTTPISSNLSASGEKTATCLPKQRGFPEPSRSRSRRGCVDSPSALSWSVSRGWSWGWSWGWERGWSWR